MQITIERNHLLQALAHVTGVVERRSTIPILSHVLLQTEDGTLRLSATDLDMEVVETVPAMVEQPGGTTVQALVFHDIVRKLPDGAQLTLSRQDDQGPVTLASGQARFVLQALGAHEFPALEADDLPHSFEMACGELRHLLEKTRFAVSTEEIRYYLNGIYFHRMSLGEKQVLRAVATDGHRLAQMEAPLPAGAEDIPGVIIPRKTVHELHRLLDSGEEKVAIALSDKKIRFSVGDVTLTSKLVDGTFPDYVRVIPQTNDKHLEVTNQEFAAAVDRVATLSTEKGRAVKLSLSPGRLVLSVNNPDSGSAEEALAVAYEGDPLEIGFNARYLLDIAAQIEGERAHFQLKDPGSPALVRDSGDEAALFVLMPMRV